ncbi:hypothetical protein XVE_1093 [Xanthomonas vesicatoria ATCC 35937]|uniref:Uncharacterized protein n=1 Tax=Xanthomonas vesicatoria ATCC 35937 TaxID=925775 RepID=F0BAI5_9XANT|nr:hypothetical protein XVE_1093 [Xanthomonas vesicatoria ATCC 35937]
MHVVACTPLPATLGLRARVALREGDVRAVVRTAGRRFRPRM